LLLIEVTGKTVAGNRLCRKLPEDSRRDAMKLKFGIAIAVLLTASLAFAQKVNTDFDHSFDFSTVHTFYVDFATPWNNQLQQDRAKRDIAEQLSSKGWTQAPDAASADVLVAIHGAVQQQKSLDTWYSGGGWGWGGGMSQTSENVVNVGTMVVDILNTHTKKLLFRGTATDQLSTKPEKNTEKLDKAVEKMFKDFPPKPKS
jgi:Domain of unknown function (DUF4136)